MQQPATRQTGIQTPSSQLIDSLQGPVPLNQPIVAAPAPGQPIMYQMRSGQLQPVLLQAVPSQPTMPQEGQHIQYYVPTGGQLVQQAQQVQPVQPVQGQGPVSGQSQHQDPDMSPIQFNKAYMKSGLGLSRFGEFFFLLGAWACIIVYSNRTFSSDGRANFFRGITIFCWVMVIIYQIIYIFGLNKNKKCFGQPSNFTIFSLSFQILLTILLISCTASLTVRAQQFSPWFNSEYDINPYYKKIADEQRVNAAIIYAALIFGYLSCVCFLDDIRFLVIIFRQERAREVEGGTAQVAQQPGISQPQQYGVVEEPPIMPQATAQATPQTAENSAQL